MKRILAAAGLFLMMCSVAIADQRSVADEDDSGSQRIWDIAMITHSHAEQGSTRLLRHTVTFYDDVSDTNFDQGFNGSGITLYFEFDRDKSGPERTAYFGRNEDDSLFVAVADRRGGIRGFANWFQPEPKELVIEFPNSLLRRRLDAYKWKVVAISGPPCEDTGAPADGCPDESRWSKHALP